jgi:hypothetical protein
LIARAKTNGERERVRNEGYLLLRSAIPTEWIDELRRAFDANVLLSEQWPVPRGFGWRHSALDLDANVLAVCRLPRVLDVVGSLIGERCFLAQVEGREPLEGAGHQSLHRDGSTFRQGDTVQALAYFDDFGPHNGATRLVPQSHRPTSDTKEHTEESEAVARQISGSAGDILVFDADLLHAATLNPGGARRRTILISYRAECLYATHVATAALRNIRMDTSDRFYPS